MTYSLELEITAFIEKFSGKFAEFRENEISENDSYDIEELIAYEKAGRPTLIELLDYNLSLLKRLIIYHQYEILLWSP